MINSDYRWNISRTYILCSIILIFTLVVSGCGGDSGSGGEASPDTTADSQSQEETASDDEADTAAAPSGAIHNLDSIQDAVVYIQAQGTFVSPEVGVITNAGGTGSGFIIDPSGIAVTNNHVVTGAASLEVFVGDESDPRNARVLGVSECSDLAVIEIDGDDFPYLRWYEGDITVGLDVFAAGFPLSDPEFTLTGGIISKADANGESHFASVERVLEHDATINPGNSGGPLVDENGAVVGVNYSGSSQTNQYFAISSDVALPLVEQLRSGENVHAIGVNGTAIVGDGLSGIWVSSVESGSPADATGILPGDIITSLERLLLATDGTMSDYCNVLRSRDAADIINIDVLRYATQEQLSGQLNGEPLEVAFSFAEEQAAIVGEESADAEGQGIGYESYFQIFDDTGALTVNVPETWSDVQSIPWLLEAQEVGMSMVAAPSVDGFSETWDTPGLYFAASTQLAQVLTLEEVLDLSSAPVGESCTYENRYEFADSFYTGLYDVWENCGGTETDIITLAATPADDNSVMVLLSVQLVTAADLEALDTINQSFYVDPALLP